MRTVIKGPKVTWVDLINPNQEDIRYLKESFPFPGFLFEDLLRPEHHPRIERYDDSLYLILYYPVHFRERRETRPREIDFIIGRDVLVTSHYGSVLPLKALLDTCNLYEESRKLYLGENTAYTLYHILMGLWKNCLRKLDQIDIRLDAIEADIFAGKEREMVKEISFVKTDIINFWRILEPQGRVMEELVRDGVSLWGPEIEHYLEDATNAYLHTWEKLKTHRETILALEDTNESLLSTKTMEIMRILTIFSTIMLPLTLLASIWGMNTYYLPFRGNPLDFWIVFSLMAASSVGMVAYFKRRGWL